MTFATLSSIVDRARESMEPYLWDFLSGGAESEATLAANRAALGALTFRTRVLVDVRNPDPGVVVFGRPLRIPVFLAPIGSIARFHPEGAMAVARVAARTGSLCMVGANAVPELSEIARAVPDAPLAFQIYGYEDHDVMDAFVRRAEQAGCVALVITADSAVYGRRERDMRNGFKALDKGRRPNMDDIAGAERKDTRAAFTWDDLAWLREHTRMPLVLKGVQDAEDAARAVDLGVETIYVSNHGGRQLDGAPGAAAVLPEIAAAVRGRATVLVDGGFQRGTDVLKGVALGATAIGIGKLQGWALAAAQEPGLERAMELLQEEIRISMALIGAPTIPDLGLHSLR